MSLVVCRVLVATRRKILVYPLLVLILLAWLSLVASSLVESILWFYEGVLGVEKGVVVTGRGLSPITALIDRVEVEEKLSSVGNVTLEYYITTPVIVDRKVVLLHSSSLLNHSGSCVWIGDGLGGLKKTSGFIVASSIFTGEVYYLEVCGYTSGYVLEAPYDLVARIRGVSPRYASYIVIRGDEESLKRAVEALTGRPVDTGLISLALVVLTRISSNETRGVLYRALTETYISSLGLQRDYILYFAYTIGVASILGSLILGLDVARRSRGILVVFRFMGVSKRRLIGVAILLGLATTILVYPLSLLLYNTLDLFRLEVLGYTVKPRGSLEVKLVVFTVLTLLYTTGLALGVKREVE